MTGAVERKNDFTQGAVPRVILGMALPLIAAQLVNVLYNVVDRIYIGHLPAVGAQALTGVGLAMPVITLLAAFAGLLGQGGAPLFSIARGRGDLQAAGRIMGNAFTLLLLAGAALTAAALTGSRWFLRALGAGGETLSFAMEYLGIYLLGTPLTLMTLGMNPYINAQGFARRGMLTVMLGAAANIVLDPIFMFGLGMGVRGAAAASVVSQGLSAAWCLSFLWGKKAIVPLRAEHLALRGRVVARMLSLGITNFVVMATNSLIQGVANRQLGLYGGDLAVGSMTVVSALRTVFSETIRGLSAGTQPVLGYNYGAGAKRRVLAAIRFNTVLGLGISGAVWAAFVLLPRPFVRLFTPDPTLMAAAIPAVRIYFCGSMFMALQFAAQSVFQGLGRAKNAITFSLLRKVVIVTPLMLLLPRWLGADGVFWSEPVSDLLGGAAAFITMLLTVYRPLARELKEESACQS